MLTNTPKIMNISEIHTVHPMQILHTTKNMDLGTIEGAEGLQQEKRLIG